MTDTLARWVTEELLGFEGLPSELDYVQSWYGIGLVVEAMEKRGFIHIHLQKLGSGTWSVGFAGANEASAFGGRGYDKQPWLAVFAAARKAVEGKYE